MAKARASGVTTPVTMPAPPQPPQQQPTPPKTIDDMFGKPGTPEDFKTAMQKANPFNAQSRAAGDKKYTHNCQRCVWATEMRRRGYDVSAMPRTSDNSFAMTDASLPNSFLNGGDPPIQLRRMAGSIWYKPKASEVTGAILRQFPDGSRGMLVMTGAGRGHVCNFEVKGSKVVLYDGQINQTHSVSALLQRGFSDFRAARMDNVTLNTKLMDKLVRRSSDNAY